MKYDPSRDIPKAIRELNTLSPSEIAQWIQEHRTETDPKTKKRIQVIRTPQSISVWFKRNPKKYEQLENEIVEEAIERKGVSERDFENGAFRQIPCIQTMIVEMRARGAKEGSISTNVNYIKRICMGQLPQKQEDFRSGKPLEYIEDWGLKHPRRLTLDDCLKFNSEMIKRNVGSRDWRLAMRCFLQSRNIKGWQKLSGAYKGAGKYAHVYAPPEKMQAIFNWLEHMNQDAHDAAYFGYKTGCRTGATLEAHAKYVDKEAHTIYVFEKASKHGATKRKLKKKISDDLWELLQPRIEQGGKLFDISSEELTGLLKACYEEVIPKLTDDIPMPFHFFRHQFAQHMLRATGWNTSLVAKLGGWTVGVLERYYGKMDEQTAFQEASKYLPQI